MRILTFNKQSVRIAVGSVAALLLAIAVIPGFFKFSSNDGVVNGRITIVKAPLEGEIHFAKRVQYGTFFKKGELIARIVNDKASASALNALRTEKATLEGRVAAMDGKIKTLQELCDSLALNLANYKDNLKRKLSSDLKQIGRKIEQEKAENVRAKSESETSDALNKRMIASRIENEKFAANLAKSNERLRELEWSGASLETVLAALDVGSFLGDSGHNDSPYSKQRMDQLAIEIALAKSVREEAVARLEGLKAQIEAEALECAKLSKAELRAACDSIVWRIPSGEGVIIAKNDELLVLLNCTAIFLDVSVSETQFANIKPGDQISYKLLGASQSHVGSVVALRGSGSVLGDINLAAELNKNSRRDFRVWIRAGQDDLSLSPENFYQVGRRVEAKIPRKWNVKDNLLKFVNVF